jgi:hypothetical protein
MKIAFQLNNIGYVESIIKFCKVDLNKSKFYETKIDSYGSLFAFKNKVLDCRSLEIRNIRPDDYIMNNTGYDYPEYIDEEYVKKINEYFETIYYNKDVCEYMWDNYALLLNGEREFQTFNIHNGKGSNSKSTLFIMLKMILGDYFCKINADTFTKQSRSANSTSELYKTKGTRLVFFNEPTDDDENKLQVSLLKELADVFKSTLPIAGVSGTLSTFCKGQCAEGKIYAKSGTMRRIKSYAGYVDTGSGKKIAFALIVNNYSCSNNMIMKKMETIMNALYQQ